MKPVKREFHFGSEELERKGLRASLSEHDFCNIIVNYGKNAIFEKKIENEKKTL